MKTIGKYILKDGETIPERDLLRWARWMQEHKGEHVGKFRSGGIRVSTIFLGLDHNHRKSGPPLLFETMIFGREFDRNCWRYATLAEAKAGHDKAVAMVKERLAVEKSLVE